MTDSSRVNCALLALCVSCCMPAALGAQQGDSLVRPGRAAATELRPPLSPRRAFLYSLVVPGYAQSVLGRERTGAMLMAFETAALFMIRETHFNVREVRRNLADSLVVSYVNPDGTPGTRLGPASFTNALLRSRREQTEDWIAVLVANHLFAAADAYVAALLWDLPAEIAVNGSRTAGSLALRFRW